MRNVGEEIIQAARSRVGLPFTHHFKPENLCEFGSITIDACMNKGLDNEGYDCSGLVIASVCDAIDIKVSNWPYDYRHLNQLTSLEETNVPEPGDVLLFYQKPPRTHMGIFVMRNIVVHASGISEMVEEGPVEGEIERISVIPSNRLLEILV